jgi:hypothetical protein
VASVHVGKQLTRYAAAECELPPLFGGVKDLLGLHRLASWHLISEALLLVLQATRALPSREAPKSGHVPRKGGRSRNHIVLGLLWLLVNTCCGNEVVIDTWLTFTFWLNVFTDAS